MIHDHNVVLPFASVNDNERKQTKTSSSQEKCLMKDRTAGKVTMEKGCSKNYQWDDILMLFVPFSDTNFMFPYGQFVLKHELDRLADVIRKILMIRKCNVTQKVRWNRQPPNTHQRCRSQTTKQARC